MHDYIVVGSGLTGVLAAEMLLNQGQTVLMLDIGEEPETSALRMMQSAAATPPSIVSEQLLKTLSRENHFESGRRQKHWFGDRVLERWKKHWDYQFNNCAEIGPATLLGGYSKVWGASCMPPDLLRQLGHLISPHETNELVDVVLSFLGAKDSSQIACESICRSDTGIGVVETFVGRYRSKCRDNKFNTWHILPSLLATNQEASACTRCGNCLIGCPVDLIFCAAHRFDKIRSHPNFHYIRQQRCVSVSESASVALVNCIDLSPLASQYRSCFSAKRVLLAAGPQSTTEILSNSFSGSSKIRMLTSQLFSFPVLSTKLSDLIVRPNNGYFGLSEAVLYEMSALRPSFFMQLYSSNNVLRYYGAGSKWSSTLLEGYFGRMLDRILIACQGYLDSDESPALFFFNPGGGGAIELIGESPVSNTTVSVATDIFKKCGYITGKVKIHPAGDGFHFGGSFPMTNSGDRFSSDMLGRPQGANRIHAIDATVLPFIPAGPFTTLSLWNTIRILRGIMNEID